MSSQDYAAVKSPAAFPVGQLSRDRLPETEDGTISKSSTPARKWLMRGAVFLALGAVVGAVVYGVTGSKSSEIDANAHSLAAASAPVINQIDMGEVMADPAEIPVYEAQVDAAAATSTSAPAAASGSTAAAAPGTFGSTYSNELNSQLAPLEQDILFKVRTAGLWEAPTGQQAMQVAGSQRVKEVGKLLASDHVILDEITRRLAAKNLVMMPSLPTAEQLGFLRELSVLQGDAYDKVFANRLRAAHGKVMKIIKQLLVEAQNPDIKSFVQVAEKVVGRHMALLESTGLVDAASRTETQ